LEYVGSWIKASFPCPVHYDLLCPDNIPVDEAVIPSGFKYLQKYSFLSLSTIPPETEVR